MLISVIMPAYNAEKTIRQAIESVMAQSFRQWELIVINDRSKDDTRQRVLELAEQDTRIRYMENDGNLGVAKTRNLGVSMARGEWIAFLDSDDAWEREKLERQVQLAERTDARLIFTGSAFMDQDGERLDYRMEVPEEVGFRGLLKQNVISCSSVLAEKALMVRYPMMPGDMHEDYAVWLKVLKHESITAKGVNEPLLIYRVSGASKSGNKRKAALMHWRVYRHIGLPLPQSVYFFSFYMVRNLKKYTKIWKETGKRR